MMVSKRFIDAVVLMGVLLLGTVLAAPVNQLADAETKELKSTESGTQDLSNTEQQLEQLVSKDSEEAGNVVGEMPVANEEEMSLPESDSPPRAPLENAYQLLDASASQNMDLTPKAVAEYLLITGDFKGFDAALMDLSTAGVLSADEARQYRDDVSWEYENLASQMMDVEANYLQEASEPIESYLRNARRSGVAPAMERRNLPANLMEDTQSLDFGSELRKLQQEAMVEREETVDQLLQAIVDEYYWRNREAPYPQQAAAESENFVEQQPDNDVEMEKVIELIQEVMNGEPMAENQNQKENFIQESVPQVDEQEAELEQLPRAQPSLVEEEGSGDIDSESPKFDSNVEVEPASA